MLSFLCYDGVAQQHKEEQLQTTDPSLDLADLPAAIIGELDIDRLIGQCRKPASDEDLGDEVVFH